MRNKGASAQSKSKEGPENAAKVETEPPDEEEGQLKLYSPGPQYSSSKPNPKGSMTKAKEGAAMDENEQHNQTRRHNHENRQAQPASPNKPASKL